MQIVSAVIARTVDACWQVFTDPHVMTKWVPGLVDARLIETTTDGLPLEIQFEFAAAHIYSLVYTYDRDARLVRWEPRPGEHGAVRGYALFEPAETGTTFTYALEHDVGRKAAERWLDNPKQLVVAFQDWMEAET
jgi:hypothetical protein